MRLIPILALAAIACSTATGPDRGLEIRAAVAPAAFRIGDPVTVTITMTNHSDAARTVETNYCFDPFVVTDSHGTVVAPPSEICPAYSGPRTLAPGDQFAYSVQWTGGSVDRGRLAPVLAPGTYVVSGPSQYDGATWIRTAVQVLP